MLSLHFEAHTARRATCRNGCWHRLETQIGFCPYVHVCVSKMGMTLCEYRFMLSGVCAVSTVSPEKEMKIKREGGDEEEREGGEKERGVSRVSP